MGRKYSVRCLMYMKQTSGNYYSLFCDSFSLSLTHPPHDPTPYLRAMFYKCMEILETRKKFCRPIPVYSGSHEWEVQRNPTLMEYKSHLFN